MTSSAGAQRPRLRGDAGRSSSYSRISSTASARSARLVATEQQDHLAARVERERHPQRSLLGGSQLLHRLNATPIIASRTQNRLDANGRCQDRACATSARSTGGTRQGPSRRARRRTECREKAQSSTSRRVVWIES